MKNLLIAGSLCFSLTATMAQTDEKKWNLGFHGGLIQYHGDLGEGFYQTDQAAYGFAGLSFSRYINRHFDAGFFFTRGEQGYIQKGVPADQMNVPNNFLTRTNTAHLLLRFYFTTPNTIFRPYLFAGAGAVWYEKVYELKSERFEFSVPTAGAGLNIAMGPVVSLQLQETFMYSSTDNIDSKKGEGINDIFLYHSAGLTFNIGKKKDEDGDGVADRKDKCPATPPGVGVDADGCPVDRDGDGVADYQDNCVTVAGVASLKGCPDKDQDGVTDNEDRCPDLGGPVALKGCPDSDNDGVVDLDDKCPGTKSGYKVDAAGCTFDGDKDGIANEDDRCPELAGSLALKGCPDKDADGVSDLDDPCPEVKGALANRGCPEMAREDILRITLIASKIYFETNSSKLKLISNTQLDDLSEILKRYNGVNLTIEGHTDNVGNDAYNLELSQKRTESVRDYLISKGINASRLTAIGYGEARPIADNNKASGKAKNRRVELKTSYQ